MPSRSPDITPFTLSPHVADLVIVDGRVVYRDERQRRKRVAIAGAPGMRRMPWEDETIECWAMNNCWETARDSQRRIAASRWWEQHQIFPSAGGKHAGEAIQNENDMKWIACCPVPLYTTEPYPSNPNALVWPVGYYAARYRDYFTCTFAYQIAQAIEEGFEEILVYGLELLLGTKREATVESSCVNYWLGLAEGKGIKVTLDRHGAVLADKQFLLYHPYRYGHDYWQESDLVLDYIGRWDSLPDAI